MKVILKEPGKETNIIEIEDKLDTYYNLIDCSTIDIVRVPFYQDIAIVVDDEGALKDKQPNFWRGNEIIYGTAIFTGVDSEDLTNLNQEQIDYLCAYLEVREI